MHEHIPWQVYDQNGQPAAGVGALRADFNRDPSLVMGSSHVWVWRVGVSGKKEILLQRRAASKPTWPGYLDISTAGHIDVGETPVEAAVREAKEEVGYDIIPSNLYYLFSMRAPLDSSEIVNVYLYELTQNENFNFHDGEVESLVWVDFDEFRKMTQAPDVHNIVPQGDAYFTPLINALDT